MATAERNLELRVGLLLCSKHCTCSNSNTNETQTRILSQIQIQLQEKINFPLAGGEVQMQLQTQIHSL